MNINQRQARPERKRGRTWCGPYALAMLTARSYEGTETLIRAAIPWNYGKDPYGRRVPIKGMYADDMLVALYKAGYKAHPVREARDLMYERRASVHGTIKTLAGWLPTRPDHNATYLIEITGHWVVVSGRKFIDNHTRAWVDLRKAPHRRSRCRRVWRVEKI